MAKAEPVALSATQSWWLLATGAAGLLPLAPHVPGWLAGFAGLTLLWRAWLARKRQPLPSRWLLTPLVFAATGVVLIQYRTLFGQNAGVALLVVFLALKQLEARTLRDGMAIVLLAYFLALAQFFYSQTIPAALATVVGTIIATATLTSLVDDRPAPVTQLRQAGMLLLQGVPFMLLLFVLFPRVQGPLWGLPQDAHSALTGLSDSMAPGSIAQLSQSDAIAFRVRFAGAKPPQPQLYWRGPVLSDFDGQRWRPIREIPLKELPYTTADDEQGVAYEITLEPSGKPWLMALELPAELPADALATRDYQLLARSPVTSRIRYQLRSQPGLAAGQNESMQARRRALNLPSGSNPRTQALGVQWRAEGGSDEDILRRAESFFRRQRLVYTLSPPLLGEHVADEFLFDSKQGFCEHFANAFVIAIRAAGMPARVVTGYQGGEINPVDGYLTVRQMDAHAWAEVWLAGRGWLRVDPTAISAPTRIDASLVAAVPSRDVLPLLSRADIAWLRDMRFRWDAMTNAWNQWVLGYNPQRQRELLSRLGMRSPDWQTMTATLAALGGMATLGIAAWILRGRRRHDPAETQWIRLSQKLQRRGLGREPWEGPNDYASRIARTRPNLATEIRAIAKVYARLRYGGGKPRLIDELRRRVASFKP